jgi:hypothetical protein
MGLPSGRPAREAVEGGGPEEGNGKRSVKDPQKEWDTFVEGLNIGEASACYLIRCRTGRKVAWGKSVPVEKDPRPVFGHVSSYLSGTSACKRRRINLHRMSGIGTL